MTKPKLLKVGSILSETQFYTVVALERGLFKVKTDTEVLVDLSDGYVEACLNSADQFEKTEKITRTALADKFLSSTRVALTVSFNTKVDEKVVEEKLKEALASPRTINVKNLVKEVTNGEERTMTGRHYGSVNEFGRVQVVDMQISKDPSKGYDTRLRQVDPRSINWLIVEGIKYEKK